jgi:hypothetical protein
LRFVLDDYDHLDYDQFHPQEIWFNFRCWLTSVASGATSFECIHKMHAHNAQMSESNKPELSSIRIPGMMLDIVLLLRSADFLLCVNSPVRFVIFRLETYILIASKRA